MKIVVHDYAGHPFQLDLSRELALKGHEVVHIYTSASGGPKASFISNENLQIIDIQTEKIQKNNFFKRMLQEKEYGKKLIKVISQLEPDVVISSNTPLDAQIRLVRYCNQHSIFFAFWLQDIISIAMRSILTKRIGFFGKTIAGFYSNIEKKALRKSDHVITIANEFNSIIVDWGIAENNITTIPNWAPIEQLPVVNKKNDFSVRHQIESKFVVLYSGTMGMKHNPAHISGLADKFAEHEDVIFLIVSEGPGMNYLKEEKKKKGLRNLKLLSFQPFEELPLVLGSSDCMLTLLEPDAGIFSVPSKVWSSYCAARPSILVMSENNLAAKITSKINAGFVIDSEKPVDLMYKKINQLINDKQLREKMGNEARKYAEQNFYISDISKKFLSIFERSKV